MCKDFLVAVVAVVVVAVAAAVAVVVWVVFDCLPHPLLIAKLYAYGFHKTSAEYLKDCLSHQKLKIKVKIRRLAIYYID